MAKWLNENLLADTKVASFDIGAIGYFGDVALVDIGGLVDPAFVPHLKSRTVAQYLKERDVGYVVLPTFSPAEASPRDCRGLALSLGLCDASGVLKTELVAFYTPPAEFDRSFAATWHAARGQTLYRIEWQ